LEVFVPRQEPIPEQVSPGYWLSDFIVLRLRVCPASAQDVPTLAWNGFTALSRYTENGAVKVFYRATDHMFPIVCLAPQTST
jgi:hypothetical protein